MMMDMKRRDGAVTADGIFYLTEQQHARIAADALDKDLVQVEGGWLAQNRHTETGSMLTSAGDVIVRHVNQRWDVWQVTQDGEELPDFVAASPPIGLQVVWSKAEAESAVSELAPVSVFWLQNDGAWVKKSN